jgi:hypothetical protein
MVSGTINTDNWKEMVHQFTGHYPPEPEEGKKEKKTSGVSSKWLKDHFNECSEHADDEVVQRHVRV